MCPECKFELIFDEKVDGPEIEATIRMQEKIIVELEEDEISNGEITDEWNFKIINNQSHLKVASSSLNLTRSFCTKFSSLYLTTEYYRPAFIMNTPQ